MRQPETTLRSAQSADVGDSDTRAARDELGQMRQIGGDDQYRRHPVGSFRLLRCLYRGRRHHCVHRLL